MTWANKILGNKSQNSILLVGCFNNMPNSVDLMRGNWWYPIHYALPPITVSIERGLQTISFTLSNNLPTSIVYFFTVPSFLWRIRPGAYYIDLQLIPASASPTRRDFIIVNKYVLLSPTLERHSFLLFYTCVRGSLNTANWKHSSSFKANANSRRDVLRTPRKFAGPIDEQNEYSLLDRCWLSEIPFCLKFLKFFRYYY